MDNTTVTTQEVLKAILIATKFAHEKLADGFEFAKSEWKCFDFVIGSFHSYIKAHSKNDNFYTLDEFRELIYNAFDSGEELPIDLLNWAAECFYRDFNDETDTTELAANIRIAIAKKKAAKALHDMSENYKYIPYIVHEGELARAERYIKRLWTALTASIISGAFIFAVEHFS